MRDNTILQASTIQETKETTKLRNDLRDILERASREAGKTPFGNIPILRKRHMGDKCFILSLDGGGLRGMIEVVLLQRLVEVFPDLLERVDLFAGVSAGSIMSSCMATGRYL